MADFFRERPGFTDFKQLPEHGHFIVRRGAPFPFGLTRQPWGMHEMQVDDPFGNATPGRQPPLHSCHSFSS